MPVAAMERLGVEREGIETLDIYLMDWTKKLLHKNA
jgi:hypothetical protein